MEKMEEVSYNSHSTWLICQEVKKQKKKTQVFSSDLWPESFWGGEVGGLFTSKSLPIFPATKEPL